MQDNKNLLITFFNAVYLCGGLISCFLRFEVRDAWIGIYWNVCTDLQGKQSLTIYICFVPFFPLIFEYFPLDRVSANDKE